jgi:hypothetical protein
MAAGVAVPLEELVNDRDPDGFWPDDEEEDPEEPPPTPAYKRFVAAAKELEEATKAVEWDVFSADEQPAPYDQDQLNELLDRMEEVKDAVNDTQALLKHRVVEEENEVEREPWLHDPPGYPEGTVRYGPMSPEGVKGFRAGNWGEFQWLREVKLRDGRSVLYGLRKCREWLPDDLSIDWNNREKPVREEVTPVKAPPPATSLDDEEFELEGMDDPMPVKVKPTGPRKEDRFPKRKL